MDHTHSDNQGAFNIPEKKWGISGSTVKLIGIITMLIDHFAAAVLARILLTRILMSGRGSDLLYEIYNILRMVGRLGFPIFCFLLVEGFEKTRSRAKYAVRLGIFALISEIPFDLAFSAKVLEFKHQNVYFTLFLGLLALCIYDVLAKHRPPVIMRGLLCIVGAALSAVWLWESFLKDIKNIKFRSEAMELWSFCGICLLIVVLLVVYGWSTSWDKMLSVGMDLAVLSLLMLLADLLRTDYSGMGVLTITVMYILRDYDELAMAGGCTVLTVMALNEAPAFFAVIPVKSYNGRRGLKLKYFFYAFYPAHLLLLWLVVWIMGLAAIPVI